MALRFDILTIFPDFFGAYQPPSGIFGHGILRRALSTGLVEAQVHNLREYAHDKHHTVDDRPFGGGEGMVLKPEPIAEAIERLGLAPKVDRNPTRETVILLSAGGKPFTQHTAHTLAQADRVVLLCGRYEGVDERVASHLADGELSVGDYVLSGGELSAGIVIDAVARLVPGVLGNAASSQFESFGAPDAGLNSSYPSHSQGGSPRTTHGAGGLLDYPHYTRPADFRGIPVPEVLTNGNHEQVRRWRREQALAKTWRNRPDLIQAADGSGLLDDADRAFLSRID